MSPKEDPDYEPTKFKKKELSSRDSKLSYIIFFSILAVSIGIADVVLFILGLRTLEKCTIIGMVSLEAIVLRVWASAGIFAVFAFIIAPVAKSTKNAWTPQTTAFYIIAPFVALLSLGIAAAGGLLGACTAYNFAINIKGLDDISPNSRMFFSLLELALVIFELAAFFLLLSAWFQIRRKRKKSKETKEQEDEEKLKRKSEKEVAKQPKTKDEIPTQTETTIPPVASTPTTAPEKKTTEETPATKTTPNVYFIQAPVAPVSNPPPPLLPPQQQAMSPYSPYANPGYYDPYDVPYYPMPMPPPPLPPPPPRRPPGPPRRPGFRPFRKGYGVRINRGYSVYPY